MSQFPIIINPSLLEPFQMRVIPSLGANPKGFKVGLLVAQAVVFTGIALVPAFFGEFILATVLLAVTVGVILAQVNAGVDLAFTHLECARLRVRIAFSSKPAF